MKTTKITKWSWDYCEETVKRAYVNGAYWWLEWDVVLLDRWNRMPYCHTVPDLQTFEKICIQIRNHGKPE